ncbi:MAG: hypothetical protein ACRDCT_12060, partial [Shewanella sp.]
IICWPKLEENCPSIPENIFVWQMFGPHSALIKIFWLAFGLAMAMASRSRATRCPNIISQKYFNNTLAEVRPALVTDVAKKSTGEEIMARSRHEHGLPEWGFGCPMACRAPAQVVFYNPWFALGRREARVYYFQCRSEFWLSLG